jgi:hypothetical protein
MESLERLLDGAGLKHPCDLDLLCAVGWCLSMGDYVTGMGPGMGPRDGAPAPPEGASVGYPPHCVCTRAE